MAGEAGVGGVPNAHRCNNGRYAVWGHSRSPLSVPMKSLYATSNVFLCAIITFILSGTVSEISRSIGQIFPVDKRYRLLLFNTLVRGETLKSRVQASGLKVYQYLEPFTRRLRVWQTDGQTDGHSDSRYLTSLCCATKKCLDVNTQWDFVLLVAE